MLPFTLYDFNQEHLSGITRSKVGEESEDSSVHLRHAASSSDHKAVLFFNSSLVNGPFFNKHTSLRTTVGTICCLSMLGAMLIIISYFLIRDIQTKSRQILVHLSFADFGVSCSNFIGVTVYFDQYIRHCPKDGARAGMMSDNSMDTLSSNSVNSILSCGALKGLCKAQAFFAGFSTLASVLWTLCLAVYIYCLVVHSNKKVHHKVLYVSYLLCWGIPLFISLWLLGTDRLGYSPHSGSGWCTLKITDSSGRQDTFAVVFGNDLWIYLTFVMVTLLYFTTHCYIKFQLKDSNPYILQGSNLATISTADTKFILIPFFFLLLRMWTMVLVILLVYAHVHPPHVLSSILLYAAGIGDSAQGFVNALLFCVFTPRVRKHFLLLLTNSRCLRSFRACPVALTQLGSPPVSQNSLSSTFPIMSSRSKSRNYMGSSPNSPQNHQLEQDQQVCS